LGIQTPIPSYSHDFPVKFTREDLQALLLKDIGMGVSVIILLIFFFFLLVGYVTFFVSGVF
jgi:hypothetical protein